MLRFFTNRWTHFILLAALLLGAAYNSGSQHRWRGEMQSFVFDELNALYPRQPSGQVLIVDIDDDSLLEIGQWPWPRTKVADLVTNLTNLGAKVIAFDGLLAEPDRSSPRYISKTLPDDQLHTETRNTLQKRGGKRRTKTKSTYMYIIIKYTICTIIISLIPYNCDLEYHSKAKNK